MITGAITASTARLGAVEAMKRYNGQYERGLNKNKSQRGSGLV
jgi:hypothetical protein